MKYTGIVVVSFDEAEEEVRAWWKAGLYPVKVDVSTTSTGIGATGLGIVGTAWVYFRRTDGKIMGSAFKPNVKELIDLYDKRS